MSKLKILLVFGTRPEAIKMAPLVHACEKRKKTIDYKICVTGQHKEMLQQVIDFFQLKADYDLAAMKPNQNLYDITVNVLSGLEKILADYQPDILLVQGDTTTAMTASLAAFYSRTKLGHIEAGLRSFDKNAPYPEEVNRKITGIIADYHFTPTAKSKENLNNEAIKDDIYVTGNTVIDALLWGVDKVRNDDKIEGSFHYLDKSKKTILITAHRRESFGEPFVNICNAILTLAIKHPDFQFVYPVHLNPNVQKIVHEKLSNQPNIFLIKPLEYPYLLWLMDKCYFVITDSGGIQEEAPSLGKPVLVLREVTERQEGIAAGTALLVGTDEKEIVRQADRLINDQAHYQAMSKAVNPYGIGDAAEKIISVIEQKLADVANN